MRKTFAVAALLGSLVILQSAVAWGQGGNLDARAWFSWSKSDSTQTNLAVDPSGQIKTLYFHAYNLESFKGGEVHIAWVPGDPLETGCFQFIAPTFPTGTACSVTSGLNRGAPVLISPPATHTLLDCYQGKPDMDSLFFGWANGLPSDCPEGTAAQIGIDFTNCNPGTQGCFFIYDAQILDSGNALRHVPVDHPTVTVLGGGVCPTCIPVEPTTWGRIKSFYRR